jgi:hypothetical protein
MSVLIGGIACEEIVADLEEGIDANQGPTASKSYLCDWKDRYTVANTLLGVSSGSAGGTISFTLPFAYPESQNMYAQNITLKGKGQPSQGKKQLAFEKAIVAVHFNVLRYSPIPPLSGVDPQSIDPTEPILYATQELDFTVETITLPGSGLQLADGSSVNEDFGLQVPIVQFNVTLHKVPFLPAAQVIAALKAPLNSAPLWGCDIRTLRFNGAKTTRTTNADGTYTQDAHYSFSYFAIGNTKNLATWSAKPNPKNAGQWLEVLTTSGDNILDTSDLRLVFPLGYLL